MSGGGGTRSQALAGPRHPRRPPSLRTPAAPRSPGPSWEVWLPTPPGRGGGFSPTGTALACRLGSCSHLGIIDANKDHG